LRTTKGTAVKIHLSLLTASSVLFDAVYVPGGEDSVAALKRDPFAEDFVLEAYKHAKAIAASGAGVRLLQQADVLRSDDEAIVVSKGSASASLTANFIAAIGKHRNWQREKMLRVDLQPASPPAKRSA
jgi:catalase